MRSSLIFEVIRILRPKHFKTAGLEIGHWAHLGLCTKLSQLMNAKEPLLSSYLYIQWKCGGCNLESCKQISPLLW